MTDSPTTPPPAPNPGRPPWAPWWSARAWSRAARLAIGLTLILYSIVMATAVPLPYIKISPGSATDVLGLITVHDTPRYKAQGHLLFLTVSLSRRLTAFKAVVGELDPNVDVEPESVITGGQSREDVFRYNLEVMQQSKLTAAAVALQQLGCRVPSTGKAVVTDVLPGHPATSILEAGDAIVAVDGTSTPRADDVIKAVRKHQPGDRIELTIERDGRRRDVTVGTTKSDQGLPEIGVYLTDAITYQQFPVEIDIDTGQVGGPSAGLAFTLATIDALTPGDLTGGKVVAVTGTIDDQARVGEVGGVVQKAAAARQAHAVMMIVPKAEAPEARAHAGGMTIVGVSDLEGALRALASIGGNADALPHQLAACGSTTSS